MLLSFIPDVNSASDSPTQERWDVKPQLWQSTHLSFSSTSQLQITHSILELVTFLGGQLQYDQLTCSRSSWICRAAIMDKCHVNFTPQLCIQCLPKRKLLHVMHVCTAYCKMRNGLPEWTHSADSTPNTFTTTCQHVICKFICSPLFSCATLDLCLHTKIQKKKPGLRM